MGTPSAPKPSSIRHIGDDSIVLTGPSRQLVGALFLCCWLSPSPREFGGNLGGKEVSPSGVELLPPSNSRLESSMTYPDPDPIRNPDDPWNRQWGSGTVITGIVAIVILAGIIAYGATKTATTGPNSTTNTTGQGGAPAPVKGSRATSE
jgi:hypothetical protein